MSHKIDIVEIRNNKKTVVTDSKPDVTGVRKAIPGVNDLASRFPAIAAEWHPTLNGDLNPTNVTYGSGQKVWWLGKCGHEYFVVINNRTSNGNGCPYCSSSKILVGFNDLNTKFPDIAKTWHPVKNGSLKPTDLFATSNQKAWWICEKGHEYESRIRDRTRGGGCPICSNKKVLAGYNDLATTHPSLVDEWHPTLNGNLKPTDITYGNSKKIWWKCNKGHEYTSSIHLRSKGSGCPYCSGNLVIPGETDLETLYPNIASQWHPTKNGSVKPSDIKPGTHNKYWFVCDNGHEWLSSVANRTTLGNSCPICCGQIILPGYNDLATLNPTLAAEWHPTKNIGFVDGNGKDISTPDKVGIGSKHKFWWLGKECKHEWQSTIGHRNLSNRGCPYCTGQKILVGFNDMASQFPQIASEWHPTLNGNIKPTDVTSGTSKKVWWICDKGHSYQAGIGHRTSRNHGCPYCSNHQLLPGYNDLETHYPEIAKEWHPTKNGCLTPKDIMFGSQKKVWWQCKHGHDFEVSVSTRTIHKSGCRTCWFLSNSSYPEQRVAYFVKQLFPDTIQSYRPSFLKGLELDVHIPSLNTVIEYDGEYFHQDTKRDIKKTLMCQQNGVRIIRIREAGCPDISKYCETFTTNPQNISDLDRVIIQLLKLLGVHNVQLDFSEFTRSDWAKFKDQYMDI